jgi:hypothetical protein
MRGEREPHTNGLLYKVFWEGANHGKWLQCAICALQVCKLSTTNCLFGFCCWPCGWDCLHMLMSNYWCIWQIGIKWHHRQWHHQRCNLNHKVKRQKKLYFVHCTLYNVQSTGFPVGCTYFKGLQSHEGYHQDSLYRRPVWPHSPFLSHGLLYFYVSNQIHNHLQKR